MENKKTSCNSILEKFFAASQEPPQYHPAFKSKLPARKYHSKLIDLADADSNTSTAAVDFFHELTNEDTGETFHVRFRLYETDLTNFVKYLRDNSLGIKDIDNLHEEIVISHPSNSNYARIEHRKVISSSPEKESSEQKVSHTSKRGLLSSRRSASSTLSARTKNLDFNDGFDDEFDDFLEDDYDD